MLRCVVLCDAQQELGSRAVMMLVGTKADLDVNGARQVTRAAGIELAQFSRCLFTETSALEGRLVRRTASKRRTHRTHTQWAMIARETDHV